MTYNTTFMDGAVSILDLFQGVSQNMPSSYMIGNIILVVFFLLFMSFVYRFPFLETMIVGGFLTTILAIFLWGSGMIALTTIIYPAVLTFLVLIFFMTKGG